MSRAATRAVAAAADRLAVHVWSRPLRAIAALCMLAYGLSLPLLLAAVALATDPPITPDVLFRLLALQVVAPALVARALRLGARGTLEVDAGTATIHARGRRIEVPRRSIVAVEPWRIPLPGPGISLRLASGRRLTWGLETRDPACVLAALEAAPVLEHPTMRWAHERAARPRRWWHPLAKFPLFALPFAALFFNVHQHIAYGGWAGQWNVEGFRPWLASFLVHWATTTVYCVLWASVWRGVAEAIAWTAAAMAPERAAGGRRAGDAVAAVAYYGGVAAITAFRFLP